MQTISKLLTADHKHCDELFVAAEECVANKDWNDMAARFDTFRRSIERHFATEENLLFPAYEGVVGGPTGPTNVMRLEHGQMRDLFEEMAQAVTDRDADAFLGLSETLLVMMQQHNLKEEQILYPMMDRAMGAERERLVEQARAALAGGADAGLQG